jgi:hypothetical protein
MDPRAVAAELGPRLPGVMYARDREVLTVLDVEHHRFDWMGWSVTEQGEDGQIRQHCTAWDPRREVVLGKADLPSDLAGVGVILNGLGARDATQRQETPPASEYRHCEPMIIIPANGRYGAETLWHCRECGHVEPADLRCTECGKTADKGLSLCAPCALKTAENMERKLFRLLDAQNTPPMIRDEDGDRYATQEWPEDPALDAEVAAAERKLAGFVQEHADLLRGTRFEPQPDDRPEDDDEVAGEPAGPSSTSPF